MYPYEIEGKETMNTKITDFDKEMSAITFAEAGEHAIAREMLGASPAMKAAASETLKKKPYLAAAVFGAISIAAYVAIFMNENWVTDTYTMGGWHAAFPVGTALVFSFIHGAFASNLLSLLGLEAKK
jgi:uncharacterized integral membrane protein